MYWLTVAVIGALMFPMLAGPARAQSRTIATLTILVSPVDHLVAGAGDRRPASDGADLAPDDTIITGPGGVALVTFLDGTTVTVEPDSTVVVRQAEARDGESHWRLVILVGKVWARIVEQLARRSSLSLESNAYAATARDGLIGAERRPDGTFVCWTRRGDVTVRDAAGTVLDVVAAGRKLTARPGRAPRSETFQVHDSTLEITTSTNVLPLVRTPDGHRVAGWAWPDVEINQVFGSLTAAGPEARRVELPAGRPGPYVIALVGLANGPYEVTVIGRFMGRVVYRHRTTGSIERGEERRAYVLPNFAEEIGVNATTSRVTGAFMEPFRSWGSHGPSAVTRSPSPPEPVR